MALKIFLQGAEGRMGKEIAELVRGSKTFQLCALTEKPKAVIDFSSPEGTMEMVNWCVDNKVALLTGTTGFTTEQNRKITQAAKKIPVLKSANFSLGINSLLEAAKLFKKRFKPLEISIEETHHIHKKDRPSGTALFLKAQLEKGGPPISEPLSLREGEVFGIHKVIFKGPHERVSFEHFAENRKVFAEGSLKAVQWLVKRKPGLYGMEDFLSGDKK